MRFILANPHLPIQLNGKIDGIKGVMKKDGDGAAESFIHKRCLRSVPSCDHLKRVKSSRGAKNGVQMCISARKCEV